jgi:D-3-phosphoglycerate dehydrogenase / 2-oxoglutarate reductase
MEAVLLCRARGKWGRDRDCRQPDLDLLAGIGDEPRPYTEVMDAWRTSRPRLPVWEQATERGLVSRRHMPGAGSPVSVSAAGTEYLSLHRGRTVALP